MAGTGSAPTENQKKAIETLDHHIAVTAGPGSGKTRVLVNRYLHIIEKGLADIENIVAITFTNKAANEMRERLRDEIDQRIINYRRTPKEHDWRERKRRLEGAAITTIHGFCSLILREHPIEAGIDPKFVILDEYSSLVIVRKATEDTVMQLVKEAGESEAQLILAYTRDTLIEYLVKGYNQLRSLGITFHQAEAVTLSSLLGIDSYMETVALLGRHIDDFAAARGLTANAQAQVTRFLAAWDEVRTTIADTPKPANLDGFNSAIEQLRNMSPDKRTKALAPIVGSLRTIIGHKTDDPLGILQAAFYDICAKPFLTIFLGMLRRIDAQCTIEKRDAACLDYEDLQLQARALLRDHPELRRQINQRYTFFLVDEFQDTNGLQRDIIKLLIGENRRPNLFVVGDRKQSVYGFRGAEVEVFNKTIEELKLLGGELIPLHENFRSDPRLIEFFNELFGSLMKSEGFEDEASKEALGFVEHELSTSIRPPLEDLVPVELMLDLPANNKTEESIETETAYNRGGPEEDTAEREARRIAERIQALVESGEPCVLERRDNPAKGTARPPRYGDIAMLFRSMTNVKYYERALQRAGVPYYVVAGRGFYDRPEIIDLLNLLSFLDNRTDELALAGILRSPLFGISDDTLLALNMSQPPNIPDAELSSSEIRMPLFEALKAYRLNEYVHETEHGLLSGAVKILDDLIPQRNRLPISELISEALRNTGYEVIIAAARDGAQRLSNIDKLVTLAQQFERGGLRLLRDFIQYVQEFRRFEAREAEALLQTDSDAVALLTVHKSKGLEFPIVILPDINRKFIDRIDPIIFDRYKGLGFKIPDGQGGLLQTGLHLAIAKSKKLRERFESMRLFYVAATRAEDFLIISGVTNTNLKIRDKMLIECSSWLHWLLRVFDIETVDGDTVMDFGKARARLIGADITFAPQRSILESIARAPESLEQDSPPRDVQISMALDKAQSLLQSVPPGETGTLRRYATTALQSFVNCPRQYYYAKVLGISDLKSPAGAPDPGERREQGRLPASLRGLVIHRFCETYQSVDVVEDRLRLCLDDVRNRRGDGYSEVFDSLDVTRAVRELTGLAENYVYSAMYARISERLKAGKLLLNGQHEFVRNEQQFILRMKQGLIFGTIDKLLLTPTNDGKLSAHIVDFKTSKLGDKVGEINSLVELHAAEYQLQMQVYSEAVRRMIPNISEVKATLQFLHPEPSLQYQYPPSVTSETSSNQQIDTVLNRVVGCGSSATNFEAITRMQCLRCAFHELCPEGSTYLNNRSLSAEAREIT